MTILAPMNPSAFAGYREAAARGDAGDNVASGRWPEERALPRSYEDLKALGLSSIWRHVFGRNPAAQALYSSLGYGITGVNVLKQLDNRGAQWLGAMP